MATVELTTEQVLALVRQLPVDRKRDVLKALSLEEPGERDSTMALAELQLRTICKERGLDWDAMNDNQRQEFVDDLVHEDRPCRT